MKTNGYNRVEIKTIDNKPIWHLLKDYINSLDIGEIFTRKEFNRKR